MPMTICALTHEVWFGASGTALAGVVAAGAKSGGESPAARIFIALGILAALILVVIVVAVAARKFFSHSGQALPETGFSISDLREMHKQGRLSDEEFAAAKMLVAQRGRRVLDGEAGEAGKSTGDDSKSDSGDGSSR